MRGDGEAHAKNLESGRMGDFYVTSEVGGSCGLRALLLRCLDGPKPQAAAKCNAHLWARLGSAIAPQVRTVFKT